MKESTAAAAKAPSSCVATYGTTRHLGKSNQAAMLTVTAGFKCAPLSAPVGQMAVAMPSPQTMAT